MLINNLKEQAEYCISINCSKCKLFKSNNEFQKCEHLQLKIDTINENEKYGEMSSKAKKKMWHLKGGVSRGKRQKCRRKRNY